MSILPSMAGARSVTTGCPGARTRGGKGVFASPPLPRFPAPGHGAFTLIEVLLAIVIFALVLAAVNGVFFGAIRLRQKTADSAAKAMPVELALATLRRDLSGIVMPGGTYAGILDSVATIQGINQQDVGTEIYTTSGVFRDGSPWADIQKVAYVLRDTTQRTASAGRDLVRVVKRNLGPVLEEQADEQRLMTGVGRLDLSFYDGTTWRTSWNSTNDATTLPKAIKVEIAMAPEPLAPGVRQGPAQAVRTIQMIVPVMVASVTNSTGSNSTTGGAP